MLNSRGSEAVLSFHQLVENSDESFLLDNEACFCVWEKWCMLLAVLTTFIFFAFVDDRIVLYGEPWFGWVSAMSFLAPEMQILISAKSCAWWTHDICGMDQPG
jgi:hypothetical protein